MYVYLLNKFNNNIEKSEISSIRKSDSKWYIINPIDPFEDSFFFPKKFCFKTLRKAKKGSVKILKQKIKNTKKQLFKLEKRFNKI